jgi:hypothetical protein
MAPRAWETGVECRRNRSKPGLEFWPLGTNFARRPKSSQLVHPESSRDDIGPGAILKHRDEQKSGGRHLPLTVPGNERPTPTKFKRSSHRVATLWELVTITV